MRRPPADPELGPVLAEYRRTLAMNLAALSWLVPLLVGTITLIVVLSLGGLGELVRGWLRPVMMAGLMPAVWLLGTSVVHVVRNWDLCLLLHEHGMVQTTWRAQARLRWDHVAELWQRGERDFLLRAIDGSEVTVDGVTWTDEPAHKVEARTLLEMLPRATETLRRGGKLQFGPLAVTRKAMDIRGHVIPWAAVELRPGLHSGMLTIRDRETGRLQFLSIRDVPNAHLLRAILPDADVES